VGVFDLYDLLLRGDRTGDRIVQPDDVIHVAAVGTQVALRGSVNKQAVYELKPSETLRELLKMAGGLTPVADRSRVSLERMDARNAQRVEQIELPAREAIPLVNGDVVRVFSAVEASLSIQRQNKRIRVEGEVMVPGEYVLPADSTLQDSLQAAGGVTPLAYLYGTQFTRESVRATQQENYDRALRDMETEMARASTTQRVSSTEEAATQSARAATTARLLEKLRALKPTGRIVFQLAPDATELPKVVLEDGDRIYIPPRASTVGVFGSVFNAGTYLYSGTRSLDDYLRLGGGPTKGADEASIFVLRANGQVISDRQRSGSWLNRSNRLGALPAEPGDTIFVPEELDKTTFIQGAKDWTQILYQLGIGLAGIKTIIP
jgi:protein involved in polysaccharide export with SLBB domain